MFTEMKNLFYRLVNRQDIFEKRNFELENTTETSKTAKKKKGENKPKKQKRYPKILGTTIYRQKDNSQSWRKYLETKQPTKD